MGFTVHKRGQGMYARASAALILGFAVLYGCWEFYQSDLLQGLPKLTYVAGLTVTWGLIVATCVFAALGLIVLGLTFGFTTRMGWLKGFENKSIGFVEFLIDVEAELRKVAWPSRKQLVNSTTVVLVTTVAFAIFIFGVDQVLQRVMRAVGIW
jgi:preprotein translocase subunit SecE